MLASVYLVFGVLRSPFFYFIKIICSIFQLGFVTMFFSDALISGYTTAAGFHALTSQLKYVFDFPAKDAGASQAVFEVPEVCVCV